MTAQSTSTYSSYEIAVAKYERSNFVGLFNVVHVPTYARDMVVEAEDLLSNFRGLFFPGAGFGCLGRGGDSTR